MLRQLPSPPFCLPLLPASPPPSPPHFTRPPSRPQQHPRDAPLLPLQKPLHIPSPHLISPAAYSLPRRHSPPRILPAQPPSLRICFVRFFPAARHACANGGARVAHSVSERRTRFRPMHPRVLKTILRYLAESRAGGDSYHSSSKTCPKVLGFVPCASRNAVGANELIEIFSGDDASASGSSIRSPLLGSVRSPVRPASRPRFSPPIRFMTTAHPPSSSYRSGCFALPRVRAPAARPRGPAGLRRFPKTTAAPLPHHMHPHR